MIYFSATNYFICILTSILLGILLFKSRYLFIKPSVIVIVFFHIQIQWASAINSNDIYYFLPNPWIFTIFSQVFPLIALIFAMATFRGSAKEIWLKILEIDVDTENIKIYIRILLIMLTIITVFYLIEVPFSHTGLYVIITNPSLSAIARENSLKLIDNTLLKYLYSFMRSAIAPMLSIFLAFKIQLEGREKRFFQTIKYSLILLFVILAASLTGARGPAASIVLAILVAFFVKSGMKINPIKILVAMILALSFPVLFSILREGRDFSLSLFFSYMTGGIFKRTFYTPMETGTYYFHFAQTVGYFGIAAFDKLARIFGVQPLWVANIIGKLYYVSNVESVNANTSFVFSYYSYFGILSFFISLVALWLLDISIIIYRDLKDTVLIATIASIFSISMAFASGDFTTVLISDGFVVVLLVSKLVNKITLAKTFK